jgi:hypothetical protein
VRARFFILSMEKKLKVLEHLLAIETDFIKAGFYKDLYENIKYENGKAEKLFIQNYFNFTK